MDSGIVKSMSRQIDDKSRFFGRIVFVYDWIVKSKGEPHLHLRLQSFSDLCGHLLSHLSLLGLRHRIDLISRSHHKISGPWHEISSPDNFVAIAVQLILISLDVVLISINTVPIPNEAILITIDIVSISSEGVSIALAGILTPFNDDIVSASKVVGQIGISKS